MILFAHYRTGERDGVALEMEKRAHVFEDLGEEVGFLSGFDATFRKNAYIIPEMDIKDLRSKFMRELLFESPHYSEDLVKQMYQEEENKIYAQLDALFSGKLPKLMFVH